MTGVYALQLLTGHDDHYGTCLSMRTALWNLQGASGDRTGERGGGGAPTRD